MAYSVSGKATDELTELIQGCMRNERGAQERIYTQFYPRMMGVVRRYIDQLDQAEEVINNGFLRAFQKIGQFNFQGSFEGWLRKIVFHAVSDYVKQNVKYTEKVLLVEKDEFVEKDMAEKMYYEQLLKLVHELPPATRSVFNMYVLDGMTHREISAVLAISEGTSKWHLSEGRKKLKERIIQLNLHVTK